MGMFKPQKPARTINVVDKGSNYSLIDTADSTVLYNCHWNGHTAPHMRVTRLPDQEPVGTATYIDKKKGGVFSTASDIHLKIHSRNLPMNKEGGVFSTDKRAYASVSVPLERLHFAACCKCISIRRLRASIFLSFLFISPITHLSIWKAPSNPKFCRYKAQHFTGKAASRPRSICG